MSNDLKEKIIKAIRDNSDRNHSGSNPPPLKRHKVIISTSVTAICIPIFFLSLSVLFSGTKATAPWGAISAPRPGAVTGTDVKVVGETRNIEPGQYIWLAVDKPRLGLCWPKSPRLSPNTNFSTVIYEGGPEEPYTISIYAVNKTVNDQWQEWIAKERFGGLPMPPEIRRLASVTLLKKESF